MPRGPSFESAASADAETPEADEARGIPPCVVAWINSMFAALAPHVALWPTVKLAGPVRTRLKFLIEHARRRCRRTGCVHDPGTKAWGASLRLPPPDRLEALEARELAKGWVESMDAPSAHQKKGRPSNARMRAAQRLSNARMGAAQRPSDPAAVAVLFREQRKAGAYRFIRLALRAAGVHCNDLSVVDQARRKKRSRAQRKLRNALIDSVAREVGH